MHLKQKLFIIIHCAQSFQRFSSKFNTIFLLFETTIKCSCAILDHAFSVKIQKKSHIKKFAYHNIWTMSFLQQSNMSRRCRRNGKQWRPWSDCFLYTAQTCLSQTLRVSMVPTIKFTDERSTTVAAACIYPALQISGAKHVLRDILVQAVTGSVGQQRNTGRLQQVLVTWKYTRN